MKRLLVVDDPEDWPIKAQDLEIVSAKTYLSDEKFISLKRARVFNLCSSYEYQALGYYVSLLAEARGHKPNPHIVAIQDMKSQTLSRILLDDFDETIAKCLRTVTDPHFTLSIYFGRTLAKRDRELGQRLFELFRCPLLRAHFRKGKKWALQSVGPISAREVPDAHKEFLFESITRYLDRRQTAIRPRLPKFWLAILHDPHEKEPPSNERALQRFIQAAADINISAELITKDDYWQLGEYDALFIRTTTRVNHYTYRFARKAEAEGLAVIDDPLSIARCTNKVFQTEAMMAHAIPIPRTLIVYQNNIEEVLSKFKFPLILKQPDSCFSMGVTKVETKLEYLKAVMELLNKSDLIIVQEYIPTEFDWRVGVIDGKPLFVTKYFMAKGHWQIINHASNRISRYGQDTPVPLSKAPTQVVNTALRAAKLMGNGLYGVDLKQYRNKLYVIEVNDNPNIDAGTEDRLMRGRLYARIMDSFANRIQKLQPTLEVKKNGRTL